jgi:uncharacterized protein
VPDVFAALAGARDICAERIAEHAEVRKLVREAITKEGVVKVKNEEHEDKVTKFDMYASFEEPVAEHPVAPLPGHPARRDGGGPAREPHRRRGPKLIPGSSERGGEAGKSPWAGRAARRRRPTRRSACCSRRESDVRVDLKMQADRERRHVFAQNLRELLLPPPTARRRVLGIDPGQRTGCKCVVVDETGKLLENTTIYLVQGDGALEKASASLKAMLAKHDIRASPWATAPTAARPRRSRARCWRRPGRRTCCACRVSEAGASVYSASDVAREEFPELDLTVRGAISIARRLQDPLAELVKIDPKSIGVGQYQHDVYQGAPREEARRGRRELREPRRRRAQHRERAAARAGVGHRAELVAKKIVAHRNEKGAFRSRKALLEVTGLGPRTFEQCAGFVRVRGGEHPLDASAVHPERYGLVERIAKDLGVPVRRSSAT